MSEGRSLEGTVERRARSFAAAGRPAAGDTTLRDALSPEVWAEIVARAPTWETPAGGELYAAGSAPPVLALLEGEARVIMHLDDGRMVTIRHARPGDCLGLAPNLAGTTATSAAAATPTVSAAVSMDRLYDIATRYPDVSWAIAAQVAQWSATAILAATEAVKHTVTERIALQLLEMSTATRQGALQVRVTHRQLADAVGTAREVVTRALHELRCARIIDARPGVIRVLDRERLAAIAAGDSQGGHHPG